LFSAAFPFRSLCSDGRREDSNGRISSPSTSRFSLSKRRDERIVLESERFESVLGGRRKMLFRF